MVRKKVSAPSNKVAIYLLAALRWLRSRPTAFRKWRKEDKKKKKYRSFQLQKRIKPEPRTIPSGVKLWRQSLAFLWKYKKVYGALLLIYAVVYVALIRSPLRTGMGDIQELLQTAFGSGSTQSLEGTLATFGLVVGSQGSQSETAASFGILVLSLGCVWVARQLHNNQKIKARDAVYQGMTPIFSVCLVLLVMSLQLIPFAVTSFLYVTARTNEIFVSGVEDLIFFIITALIGILSLYWITSTVIALYAVSLPGMYPMKALRAAKKLVKFQRLAIFRRILVLPLILGILYTLILLVIIRIYPDASLVASEIMLVLCVPIANVYLYKLYRTLI